MSNEAKAPQGNPGDIVNWPMLKIQYRTDPDKIAALLPPGIEPGAQANVSANIGCIQHLQSGTGTPVRHWVEVLDDALAAAA